MSKDYVRGMIARHLGVSESYIALWRVTVGAGSQTSMGGRAHPTPLEAELEVTLLFSRHVAERLIAARDRADHGGMFIKQTHHMAYADPDPMGGRLAVDITLAYGKSTQHLFKAMYQTMTVRGPQKRKKKK